MAGQEGNKVSIRRIIGNVADKLQLDNVSSRISAFANWAVDAEIKIGSKNSYESVECEIEVKNYRACLPDGFVYLIALKHNQDYLEASMKDFVQWHKGVAAVKLEDDTEFIAGNKIQDSHPGVPNAHQVNFIGIFQPGDIINITVTNDNCGHLSTNVFNYIVEPADTIQDIIAEFVGQINAINAAYHAVPDSTFLQIIADTPLINMQLATFTDSSTGTVNHQLLQRRILPTDGAPSAEEDCLVPINQTSNNLADRTAYNLNTGTTSETPYYSGNGYYNSGGDLDFQSSKFAIRNGIVHLNAIQDGKIGISYVSVSLDEEGWPLIDQSHEDAVTQYIMWQAEWGSYRKGKVSVQYFKDLEARWYWLCGQARGDDELPNEDELQYLANAWNQLIPLPNKEFF